MRELAKDNSATFHSFEGEVDSGPGPGVEGFFEGPFFSYYKWPRTFQDDEQSIMEAYEMLFEIIEEEGPFDGVLGFSHGGALATGFIAHHVKHRPYEPAPFRCAVFFNSMPPFRMDDEDVPIFESGLEGLVKLPTLHVVGSNDFVYPHSMRLYKLCEEKSSNILMHDLGHEIPRSKELVAKMAAAIRELGIRAMF